MSKTALLSPRQKKSQQTWDSILHAVVKLLKKHTYDSLTVRNICDAAGVSTGTFYHHFNSKENLLTYYLTDDFLKFAAAFFIDIDGATDKNPCDKIIDIYTCCAEYTEVKGVAFISSFYSPKNKSLLPPGDNKDEKSISTFTPIFERTLVYMVNGQNQGLISDQVTAYTMSYDLCMLFNGIIYGWCISEATLDLKPFIRKMLGAYINNVITDKFIQTYGKYGVPR